MQEFKEYQFDKPAFKGSRTGVISCDRSLVFFSLGLGHLPLYPQWLAIQSLNFSFFRNTKGVKSNL